MDCVCKFAKTILTVIVNGGIEIQTPLILLTKPGTAFWMNK